MSTEPFTILFSCIGRRMALVNAFRKSLADLGLQGRLLGADRSSYSAAMQVCDRMLIVPESRHDEYVGRLLDICRTEQVDLLIPLIDPELHILSGLHERFADLGTTLCLSSPEVVDICGDKVLMHDTLLEAGIDTPKLLEFEDITEGDLPVFMKPRAGSSADDIHRIDTLRQLSFYHKEVTGVIVQEYVEGQEYTLDIFCDFAGQPRCAVPRKRIEVRAGEVVKSMTEKDPALIEVGMKTCRVLSGCIGPVTLQCFRSEVGRIAVIEINPRLGGGVPLSIEAGADIPGWTIQCALGQTPKIDPMAFQDQLVMLRYDEAVFVAKDDLPK